MPHFAKVNNGIVEQVIVAESDFFDGFVDTSPGTWIETFKDGGIRKHYAGIGYTYDFAKDIFIEMQPFPSWTLNEESVEWEPPVTYPNDGKRYHWNESTVSWDEVEEV